MIIKLEIKNYLSNKIVCIILVFLSLFITESCSSVKPCPDRLSIGNPGAVINTDNNDYLPVIYNDYLYFTSIRENKNKTERLFRAAIIDTTLGIPEIDSTLPLNNFPRCSSPSFYIDTLKHITEIYFAAIAPGTKNDIDIFYSVKKNGIWSRPEPMNSNINTEYYESHPAISPDGKILLFSSDRPGSIGETDIYISRRNKDGTWQKAENLGSNFNTPGREIAPFIDNMGNLFFSSNGYRNNNGLDILKADSDGKGGWLEPKLLSEPINSAADDFGTAIYGNKIFLSSNRIGGCGAYDIYSFMLCGPVFLSGLINSKNYSLPLDGKVEIFDDNGKLIYNKSIINDSTFDCELQPNRNYLLHYENNCLPSMPIEKKIISPCSDTTIVKLFVKINLPDRVGEFIFEQYDVPFFVTGYYMPNTAENLESLKMKFQYNLFGDSDSLKYIENPESKYDEFVPKVEEALDAAVSFIIDKLKMLKDSCFKKYSKMRISLTGYTDPRPISDISRYIGPDIDDKKFNMKVDSYSPIDNQLLSKLRAYFTSKLLQTKLLKYDEFIDNSDNINWEVFGKGIDSNENQSLEKRRRVNIVVSFE